MQPTLDKVKLQSRPERKGSDPAINPLPNAGLAILLPNVWSFRNVIYSGVLGLLRDSGVEPHLICSRWSPDSPYRQLDELKAALSISALATLKPTGKGRGRAFLQGVLFAAHNARHQNRSYHLYQRWLSRRKTASQRTYSLFARLLSKGAKPSAIYHALYRFEEALYERAYDFRAVEQQLRRLAPAWLWSTVSVASEEQPYIFAAQKLRIPIVTSILGFDNLTSRWARPRFDHYLLWSEVMKAQLLRVLPEVRPAQISVTGTPQFDFHRRQDLVWSRAKTLQGIGLSDTDRYFVYGASAESLTPDEPELVAQIASRMGQHPLLKSCHLVVRLHPLDNWKRWEKTTGRHGRIIISPAWDNTPEADGWAFTTLEDQSRLVNTLRHSEGCLNVASTISLDAAILDKPVICIDFRSEPDCPREILYEEYDTEHYLPLVQSGGIRVAHNWRELVSLLARAIEAPEEDREKRRQMIERECGQVDGQAAKRVTDALLKLLE
jgi:hypothetical protein